MRVYGMLFSALATAAMIGSAAGAATAESSITAVDVARERPAGNYAGIAWRYVEGVIRGEVAIGEPVAGLSELAAGRTSVPYEIFFDIVAPESGSDASAIVVEAPNRGNPILARTLGAPIAMATGTARSARPGGSAGSTRIFQLRKRAYKSREAMPRVSAQADVL